MENDSAFIFENIHSINLDDKTIVDGQPQISNTCGVCSKEYTDPVVLNCLHVFDKTCLLNYESAGDFFTVVHCPRCGSTSGSVESCEPFHIDILEKRPSKKELPASEPELQVRCTLCTTNSIAFYKCVDCSEILCKNCRNSHKVLKMFSSHSVTDLTKEEKSSFSLNKPVHCSYHNSEVYRYFCFQCNIPLCNQCLSKEHTLHITCKLEEAPEKLTEVIHGLVVEAQSRQTHMREIVENFSNSLMDVTTSREQNVTAIEKCCENWKLAIDEIKNEFLSKNKEIYDQLETKIKQGITQLNDTTNHIDYAVEFIDSYLYRCCAADMAKTAKLVMSCLEHLSKVAVDTQMQTSNTFVSNPNSIKPILRAKFGYFEDESSKQYDSQHSTSVSPNTDDHATSVATTAALSTLSDYHRNQVASYDYLHQGSISSDPNAFASLQRKHLRSIQQHSPTDSQDSNLAMLPNGSGDHQRHHSIVSSISSSSNHNYGSNLNSVGMFNGSSSGIFSEFSLENRMNSLGFTDRSGSGTPLSGNAYDHGISLDSTLIGHTSTLYGSIGTSSVVQQPLAKPGVVTGYNPSPNPPFPNRTNRCHQMNVRNRWGSLGSGRGQLSSPHGFCLGFDEEIVVADTQNHRIQCFDKNGVFRHQFGISGREEGQLWFPRKVAIINETQKYVVCDRGNERSRMQIFTRSGHFMKKISIRYIDIVAGLAINKNGHIVAVDSVSPSVFIIAENGELVKWFDCSDFMREPSDIAISGNEYYVCDFKGHCVAVFQEDGQFLRRIGSEAVTNFPNGIDVSDAGDVLIGDSHGNRFHIAVYSAQGLLTSEFECPSVKVSRCCGLKITSEGYVVTLAKNNHHVLILDTLYIA